LLTNSAEAKTLAERMRCSHCGKKAAEVVAVAKPRPREVPKIARRFKFVLRCVYLDG
jgi:hypothetical protein